MRMTPRVACFRSESPAGFIGIRIGERSQGQPVPLTEAADRAFTMPSARETAGAFRRARDAGILAEAASA